MLTFIKAANILTSPEENTFENGYVVIENDKIRSVERGSLELPADAKIIDIGNRTALPGLIDCHVHTGLDGTIDMEKTLLELFPFHVLKAGLNVKRDLEAGFTTLRCMGDKGYLDIGLKLAIEKGAIIGPRLITCGHAITITGGHADMHFPPDVPNYQGFGVVADGPDEVRKAARQQIRFGADLVKLMVTGGVLSGADEPGAQQLSLGEIQVAVEEAKRAEKKVAAHAQGNSGIKDAIRGGVNSIEHGFFLDDESLQMLLETDTYLCPVHQALKRLCDQGPESGLPDYAYRKAKFVEKASEKSLQRAIEAGVKIVAGTDVGTAFNPHGENAEELELLVKNGMSTQKALASATTVASELLGMGDKIGTLASGKYADIIAVKGNPLLDIGVLKKIDFVMKGGEIVKNFNK
jgi:imidazolonepropionase-like amidohydrolase